jgi:hypothetical protein
MPKKRREEPNLGPPAFSFPYQGIGVWGMAKGVRAFGPLVPFPTNHLPLVS